MTKPQCEIQYVREQGVYEKQLQNSTNKVIQTDSNYWKRRILSDKDHL